MERCLRGLENVSTCRLGENLLPEPGRGWRILDQDSEERCDVEFLNLRGAADAAQAAAVAAASSARYILAEFRSAETLKGRMNAAKARHGRNRWLTNGELVRAAHTAGMVPLRIAYTGEFSDHAWLLLEPAGQRSEPAPEVEIRSPASLPIGIALFLTILVMYLVNIGGRSFWGENEAYYALGARSVLSGQYLLPAIHGDVLADKPPLVFWWVAAVSAFFGGVSEWTARFSNILMAMAVLAGLQAFATRWLSRWVGLIGVLVLATCWEFWENAKEVNTDITLVACLTWAWGLLFSMMERSHFRRGKWLLAWSLLGVAMLAKGPVALLLSGALAFTYAMVRFGWSGGWSRLWKLRPLTGCAIALAPFALWIAALWMAHGSEPVSIILLKHNVQRFVQAFDHQRPWYFYFTELPINILPWTPLALFVGISLWRRRRVAELPAPVTFALCAVAVVFVFFSLSSSKRDYYLLPLMPWVALLIAEWLHRALVGGINRREPLQGRDFGGLLLSTTHGRLLLHAGAAAIAAFVLYAGVLMEFMDKRKSALPFTAAVEQLANAEGPLVLLDEEDPRILYYLKEKYTVIEDDEEGLARIGRKIADGRHVDILVSEDDLRDLRQHVGALFISGTSEYRGDKYYLLTNHPESPLEPFTEKVIPRDDD